MGPCSGSLNFNIINIFGLKNSSELLSTHHHAALMTRNTTITREYSITSKINAPKKKMTVEEDEEQVEDPKNQKITPMMSQYFKIKEKHSDYLLLFRMGDFYEIFFEDAVKASQVLHITVGLLLIESFVKNWIA